MAQLVDEGSRLLRPAGRVAELFQEPRDVGTTTITPCHGRDSFHKVVGCREWFGKDEFDPVFDLWCDFFVRRCIERVEQVADLVSKDGLATVITRSVGHDGAMIRSVVDSGRKWPNKGWHIRALL